MPDNARPSLIVSAPKLSYEIVEDDRILKVVKEHTPSIALSTPLLDAGCRPWNKAIRTPDYGAGFFIDGLWFRNVYLPRVKLERCQQVLQVLRRDAELNKILHPTMRIVYYHDFAGCAFVSLCSNSPNREPWFSHRNEVLDAVCKAMQFTEAEMAQAKGAFSWHMFDPPCYAVIPKEFVVGI